MRILVHHRIASRDGQSVHLEELAGALRRNGHTVLIVGPSSFAQVRFGAAVSSVEFLKRLIPKPLFEIMEIAYNAIAHRRLSNAINQFKPDVIYERFSLFLFCGIWASRKFGIPILLEVNSPLFEERVATNALTLKWVGRRSQRWLFRQADAVLPVTEVLAETILQYGASREKIFVVPNGINPSYFERDAEISSAKNRAGIPPRLVIGFVGFVREWNAVHKLINFAALYKDRFNLHVLIVGDGPARASIECEAQQIGLTDRVTITGVVGRDHISNWISAMDIAVLPAVTKYSSPLKLFEYMYLSRAIIAPDLPNIREILTDEFNALLFGSEEGQLELALQRLCEDPGIRMQLGRNAYETIERRDLTWDGNAIKVGEIAIKLAKGGCKVDR